MLDWGRAVKKSRLQRDTPLRSTTGLSRTGGLSSSGPVKPRRQCTVDDCFRTVWAKERCARHYQKARRAGDLPTEEERARRIVKARASVHGVPVCEACGVAPMTEYQHRKAKVHCTPAELWDPANGLAVCGHGNVSGCHGRIHQNPTEAYANGWSVRSFYDPANTPVLRRGDLVWLRSDGTYIPALGGAA